VRCLWGRSPAQYLSPRCTALSSPVGACVAVREESYRLYSCRCCGVSVSLCGRCDRGNIYCAGECAVKCRRESRRRAGARYQRTRRGAQCHAARQQAWRERCAQKVTHQGCASTGPVFTMSITVDMAAIELHDAPSAPEETRASPPKRDRDGQRQAGRCDFCHAPLPAFTRLRTWRGWGFG
jgi:hypothetical protein